MKFFVDTADIAEIRDLAESGLLDGVTTNPTLVAKAGRDFNDILRDICAVVDGPVSAEVTATRAISLYCSPACALRVKTHLRRRCRGCSPRISARGTLPPL